VVSSLGKKSPVTSAARLILHGGENRPQTRPSLLPKGDRSRNLVSQAHANHLDGGYALRCPDMKQSKSARRMRAQRARSLQALGSGLCLLLLWQALGVRSCFCSLRQTITAADD